jgi:hypothetical protein
MSDTSYDEASRYLTKESGAPMVHWLLALDDTRIGFGSLLDPALVMPDPPATW